MCVQFIFKQRKSSIKSKFTYRINEYYKIVNVNTTMKIIKINHLFSLARFFFPKLMSERVYVAKIYV